MDVMLAFLNIKLAEPNVFLLSGTKVSNFCNVFN